MNDPRRNNGNTPEGTPSRILEKYPGESPEEVDGSIPEAVPRVTSGKLPWGILPEGAPRRIT